MVAIDGEHFVDAEGRTLLLRGINLGGSTKVPVWPDGATHNSEGFFAHRDVSFVGRPFPLAEADEHFGRLRSWGITFLRFLVTWEAIEHAGPGIYDHKYLDYVAALIQKAADYGISLFVDPHQDVWSRFTGGDGAPGWTLEAAGMQLEKLHEAGAAFLHQVHGDPFPQMIWPTNGVKLAAATMFTLFFAGNDFAPLVQVDSEPIQEYLQRHYCAAMAQLAQRLRSCSNVVGYETMNEPLHGYIGCKRLDELEGMLRIGVSPTAYQGMLLGAGYTLELETWKLTLLGARVTGKQQVNTKQVSIWREPSADIWLQHGVWERGTDGTARLLRPDYFSSVQGRPVNFSQDYYRPFANRFAQAIRAAHPQATIFVETEVGHQPPQWGPDDASNVVYAPHWYEPLTLFMKHHTSWLTFDTITNKVVIGPRATQRVIASQLRALQVQGHAAIGKVPVMIGETGIPFDLDKHKAYRNGDFRAQIAAIDRIMRALEATLFHVTWWNYTSDNTNERGDQWNGEDLSIFSRDQQHDRNAGGRALEAFVRPYPRATAGQPIALIFEPRRGIFRFTFRHDPAIDAPTEIFVPTIQYPRGYRVEVSDGTFEQVQVDGQQICVYRHNRARSEVHSVRIWRV